MKHKGVHSGIKLIRVFVQMVKYSPEYNSVIWIKRALQLHGHRNSVWGCLNFVYPEMSQPCSLLLTLSLVVDTV